MRSTGEGAITLSWMSTEHFMKRIFKSGHKQETSGSSPLIIASPSIFLVPHHLVSSGQRGIGLLKFRILTSSSLYMILKSEIEINIQINLI